MPSLLVIDDEPLTLDCFRYLFPKTEVTVTTAATAAEGLQRFTEQRPDAVVIDVRLPDLSGLEAFKQLHALDAKIPVILMTGHGTADTAIEAMRLGAFEYVLKPPDTDKLRELLKRAFATGRAMRVPAKVADTGPDDQTADILVGRCEAMQEVYKAIGRVAGQDVTVLLLGESGTGKELAARAIYHYSRRAEQPFLAVNCAAIPEALLESELFGHEKGAFTGADRRRIGKFEQGHGGTLFLDEIGDMTPLTQAKTLRVLQDHTFERVGGNETLQADVRIIAATNKDLEAMVTAGQFRRDLFYRLNVFTLRLPPLRERGEDLPLLARHFQKRFARTMGKDVRELAPETLELLEQYFWPGNVRELQSVVKQALLHAAGPVLVPEHLPPALRRAAEPVPPATQELAWADLTHFVEARLRMDTTDLYAEFLAVIERHLLLHVLRHVDNNLSQAARVLGISRTTLRSKLYALGITVGRTLAQDEGAS
jgi:DNA-binding NtrC family response regulator